MARERQLQIVNDIVHFKSREYLSPNYIRVTLNGPGVQSFANATNGVNNKIMVPPRGVRDLHLPTADPVTGEMVEAPIHLRPLRRTYTHRGVDLAKQELYIEFIAHTGAGAAGHWSEHAEVGDPIQIFMKDGHVDLVPPRDWYVLAGDATAIPVIRAILETFTDSARGHVFLEIDAPEEIQQLTTQSQLEIHWLIREPNSISPVPAAVRALNFPSDGTVFAYVAGEYQMVKALRTHLREDRALTPDHYWAYSYWKRGIEEHLSEPDRREERATGDALAVADASRRTRTS